MEQEEFRQLKKQIAQDTMYSSNPSDFIEHPATQQLIAQGRRIIPMILEDFAKDGGFAWDLVLEGILGHHVSPEEHRGYVEAIRQDWLKWGRERGFITLHH